MLQVDNSSLLIYEVLAEHEHDHSNALTYIDDISIVLIAFRGLEQPRWTTE